MLLYRKIRDNLNQLKNKKTLRTKSEGFYSVGDTGFEPVTPCL
jgi:hypothetical protein